MPISHQILNRIKENDETLSELDLSNQSLLTADIWELVKALEHNTHLLKLNLNNNKIGDKEAEILAKNLHHVSSLEVSGNNLGDIGAEFLSGNPSFRLLNLNYNQIGDKGAVALAQNNTLTSLMLKDNKIHSEGVVGFSENMQLLFLDLSSNLLDSNGAIALARNTKLTDLILNGNKVGNVGAMALAQKNSSLTSLHLSDNQISEYGAIAFGDNITLIELNLSKNRIGVEGARGLAQNTHLRLLAISENHINNLGVSALAIHPTLEWMDFSYNQVNDIGAIELAKIRNLRYLNVGYNQIGAEGAKAFSLNENLTTLIINHNLLKDNGASHLAESKSLKKLNLTANQVGFEGAMAFANNKVIIELNLSANNVNDAGAIFLARNPFIRDLSLSLNKVGDAGAMALANNTTIARLSLESNRVNERGKMALAANKTFSSLSISDEIATDQEHTPNILLFSQDFFCIFGLNGVIKFINATFCRVLGYNSDELLSKSFLDFLHPFDRMENEKHLLEISGLSTNFENRFLCKDGSPKIIRWNFQVRGDNIYSVGSDITEQRKLEKELDKSLRRGDEIQLQESKVYIKKQSQFIAELCHEIRNPLSGTCSLVESLREQFESIQNLINQSKSSLDSALTRSLNEHFVEVDSMIKDIGTCVQYEKAILDNNVDWAKITEKKLILEKVPVDYKNLILETVAMFRTKAIKKGLLFKVQLPSEKIIVWGDDIRLKQILVNLIGNAVKFTDKGSIEVVLDIAASEKDTLLINTKVSIIDTGAGLTVEESQNLFERFQQVKLSTGNDYEGAGLGLYLAKSLATLMSGSITVESQKGKGTNISLIVPFEKCPKQKIELMAPAESSTPIQFHQQLIRGKELAKKTLISPQQPLQFSAEKILIVDDNEINRKILFGILKEKYECFFAINGLEAIEMNNNNSFDVIIMDIVMPKMDGIAATKEIRKREQERKIPEIPIIGVSANVSEIDKSLALAAGMNDYITKPFKKQEIITRIEALKTSKKPNAGESSGCKNS